MEHSLGITDRQIDGLKYGWKQHIDRIDKRKGSANLQM